MHEKTTAAIHTLRMALTLHSDRPRGKKIEAVEKKAKSMGGGERSKMDPTSLQAA